MNIISLPRGQGKTTLLIKMSAETGIPILTFTRKSATFIFDRAKELNLDIPFALIIDDNKQFMKINSSCNSKFCFVNVEDIKEVLIDELDIVLKQLLSCDVNTATITETKEYINEKKNQSKNTLIKIFTDNLATLTVKYGEAILKGDINSGLNILKNIDMVNKVIKDIQEK